MKVYHGSYIAINKVELSKCKPGKDFGCGWSDTQATSKYYASKIWKRLIDETTGLYTKPWKAIYRMLLQELKLKNNT